MGGIARTDERSVRSEARNCGRNHAGVVLQSRIAVVNGAALAYAG